MKGATLHQRMACGATPRRCWPASARPGTRVCVIVPSKDNAPGSGGKRMPLLWTFSDSGSGGSGGLRGVLKHKQVLEEVYSRDAAEPHYEGGAATSTYTAGVNQDDHSHPQEQQQPEGEGWQQQEDVGRQSQHESNGASVRHHHCHHHHHELQQQQFLGELGRSEEGDSNPAALRERIASAALASSSATAGSGFGSEGRRLQSHSHQQQLLLYSQQQQQQQQQQKHQMHRQQQHEQQKQLRPVSAPHTTTTTALNGAGSPNGAGPLPLLNPDHHNQPQPLESHHHQQGEGQQQQHAAAAPAATHPHQPPSQVPQQPHQVSQLQQHLPCSNGAIPHSTVSLPEPSGPAVGPAPVPPSAASPPAADPAAAAAASSAPATAATAAPSGSSIPGSIWILCFISAALTCASCVFNTALPIYMVSELKMSMRSMGMFEGLLEAFSYVVRMCSGVVSDRMTSRKAAITLGFAAGALAKFGMASAGTVGLLFAGKAVDRLANGIQAAPRDALIGDLSPPGVRSACFGLAQSLRKWGSAVGALAAFFLMKASNNNYQLIFYSAATVSLVACIAFVVLVPAHKRTPAPQPPPEQLAAAAATTASAAAASSPLLSGWREAMRSLACMGTDFYRMLGVISLYALGHINESLLEARAMEVGFGKAEATLVVAAIAAVTFLTAYPLGLLDDKYGAGTTFAVGISALIAGDLVLLLSGPHPLALFASCLFLGVHWAVIQGPLLSIVSGLAPAHMRGTAFGIFYTVMAVTAVVANTMYGSIWHTYGANAAFMTSAALMSAVLAALPYMLPASARRGTAPPPAQAAVGPLADLSVPSLGGSGDGGKAPGLMPSPLPAAA